MANTSRGLPLIDNTFAPDGPNQMNALANAVDAELIDCTPSKRRRGQVVNATTGASGVIQVTHGLGVTPVIVLMQVVEAGTVAEKTLRTSARTSTTFDVMCFYNGVNVGSGNAGWSFDWIAEA